MATTNHVVMFLAVWWFLSSKTILQTKNSIEHLLYNFFVFCFLQVPIRGTFPYDTQMLPETTVMSVKKNILVEK